MSKKSSHRGRTSGGSRRAPAPLSGGGPPSRSRAWLSLVLIVAAIVVLSSLFREGGPITGTGDLLGVADTPGQSAGGGDGESHPGDGPGEGGFPGDADEGGSPPGAGADGGGSAGAPAEDGGPASDESPPSDGPPAGSDPWDGGWLTADFPDAAPEDLLLVTFFDVGQGDASLIQARGCTILIDAGRHDRHDVPGHLAAAGVEAIDYFIFTHPHADHIGQAPEVLREYPVGEVWASGWEHPTRTFERTLDAILDSDAGYREPRAGYEEACGPVTIQVINPVDPLEDIHDDIAVRIVFGEIALVWTGDAEDNHEAGMIARGHELGAQVLQLGHHGSSTSSSRPFVEAVDPRVAIYSAEKDNSYGHPHRETVSLMDELGIPMYGTDDYGTIWVAADGRDFRVKTEKEFYGGTRR